MIIGISAKTKSGKDLVGSIIQYLVWKDKIEKGLSTSIQTSLKDFSNNEIGNNFSGWKIVKYADKLKDIVCLLIGCTRQELESQKFKETELGEEWWYYKSTFMNGNTMMYSYLNYEGSTKNKELVCLTPRLLLQLIGTQCGRQIIHPNIWVNATMSEYVPLRAKIIPDVGVLSPDEITTKKDNFEYHPDWIITDVRFPNEAQVIKEKKGIVIRIERPINFRFSEEWEKFQQSGYKDFTHYLGEQNPKMYQMLTHESETGLDNYKGFNYVITNGSNSIDILIEEVKQILIKEKIL